MSVTRHTVTTLTCEVEDCGWAVKVQADVSKAAIRKKAREQDGWRVDKLNRDICGQHPRLSDARRGR
jgi:hypothetical protein